MAGRPWWTKRDLAQVGRPGSAIAEARDTAKRPLCGRQAARKTRRQGAAPATKPTKAYSTKAWGAPWRRVSVSASPKNTDELACKPDPVPVAPCGAAGGGHPSRPAVAGRLQRPTRRLGRAVLDRLRRSVLPFGLAPGGVYLAIPVTRDAGGLLHHRFTLTSSHAMRRSDFCGTFPRVPSGRCYRPPCPVEPGLSSADVRRHLTRPPGRLVRRTEQRTATYCSRADCRRPPGGRGTARVAAERAH